MSDYQGELNEAACEIVERCGPQGDMTTQMHPVDYALLLKEVYALRGGSYSGVGNPTGLESPLKMFTASGQMVIVEDSRVPEGTFYMRCDNGGESTMGPFKSAVVDRVVSSLKAINVALAPPHVDPRPPDFATEFQEFIKGEDDD